MPLPTPVTNDTPGRVVLQALRDADLVRLAADPVTDSPPRGYAEAGVDDFTDNRDRVVLTTTTPMPDGHYGYNGQLVSQPGYQLRVDAATDQQAHKLAQTLSAWLGVMTNQAVTIGGTNYLVYSATLTSGPNRLGRTSGDLYTYTCDFISAIDQT